VYIRVSGSVVMLSRASDTFSPGATCRSPTPRFRLLAAIIIDSDGNTWP
jgi:hypothetical protein